MVTFRQSLFHNLRNKINEYKNKVNTLNLCKEANGEF